MRARFQLVTWMLVAAVAMTGPPRAHAQSRAAADIRNAPAAPRITVSQEPTFTVVPGTQVYWWSDNSTNYDVYRFGSDYFVSDEGWWYRGRDVEGPYAVVRETVVPPSVLTAVEYNSRDNRDNLDNRDDTAPDEMPTARLYVREQPEFRMVEGTGAYWSQNMPDGHEVYRVGANHYLRSGGFWYRSTRATGPYYTVSEASVPRPVFLAMSRVSRNSDQSDNVDYRNAPPAPRIVFRAEPRFARVPSTMVDWWMNAPAGYEVYRAGPNYYLSAEGYWYRSNRLRGPWYSIRENSVPNPVFTAVDYRSRHGDDWARMRIRRYHRY